MSHVLDSADERVRAVLCRILNEQEIPDLAANVRFWRNRRVQDARAARRQVLHTPHRQFLRRELKWARRQEQAAIARLAKAEAERGA